MVMGYLSLGPWFIHCTLTHAISRFKNHQSGYHLAIMPSGFTFRLRPPCPNPRRKISVAMLVLPALIGGKRLPPVGGVLGSVRSFISIKGASVNAWRPQFFVGYSKYEMSTTAVRRRQSTSELYLVSGHLGTDQVSFKLEVVSYENRNDNASVRVSIPLYFIMTTQEYTVELLPSCP
ncbi:hypothetical protein EDB85DRAFT_257088 [Lactarius pseudohatsudake]|nr:hypothetical protein EDB85DRAFT_257088 [Lactarius pseudohatsudake]